MPVRWVVCDAVGTLIYAVPDVATTYHQIGRRHGSVLSRSEISTRFSAAFQEAETRDSTAWRGSDGNRPDTGGTLLTCESLEKRRWRRIVDSVLPDVDSPDACFDELFEHFGKPSSWACFEDVHPTLTGLQRRGIRLAIASNFDSRLHTVCDGLEPLRTIEHCVVSSEVGFRKPSRSFYDAVLCRIGSAACEVLMVGDDLQNDVCGAQSAGIRAALIFRGDCENLPPNVAVLTELLEIETLLR
ncbi:MAG: HAD-IA family hydrolase [Planctomycetaceae bacterium]